MIFIIFHLKLTLNNSFFFIFADTFFSNVTSSEIKGTTQIKNQTTLSGPALVIKGVSLKIVFLSIALVAFFAILGGFFVGTYVNKHCVKQTTAVHSSLKQQDGYDNLELDVHAQTTCSLSRPPTYLEPVLDTSVHYEEINN